MLEKHPMIKENKIFFIKLKNAEFIAQMSTGKTKWVAAIRRRHNEKKPKNKDNGVVKIVSGRNL